MSEQTAEPTPLPVDAEPVHAVAPAPGPPEWARAWAERAYLNLGSPIENFAAALVAARREALTEAARFVETHWEAGPELFEWAGRTPQRDTPMATAIRALAAKAPT